MLFVVKHVTDPIDDPYVACKAYQAGDVIDMFDDKFDLNAYHGVVEQVKLGRWVIVQVPWTQNECLAMLQSEPGDEKTNKMLQRRAFKLSLENLSDANVKAEIANAAKADSIKPVALADLDSKSVKIQREALADPAIIGPIDDGKVIG